MLVAKLTISYDRGLAHNDPKDLETGAGRGFKTQDGKIIRGLGTHYRSETDASLVQERDKEAKRVYNEFRARFLSTPIDGVYIIPKAGAAEAFIKGLEVRSDIRVRVAEFKLESTGGLDGEELAEWAERVKRQLNGIALGRSKEADEDGLRALETLAACPVLKKSTGTRIRELVAMVRDHQISRVELRRKIDMINVEVEGDSLAPRKTPDMVEA